MFCKNPWGFHIKVTLLFISDESNNLRACVQNFSHNAKVFGIAGHSGMGKTTLLEKLIPVLTQRGLRVSLIKHSHKDIEIDRPGKDSYRLREAGCSEVLLMGKSRWALMHEQRNDTEPSFEYLLSRMQACDLVLVEGFKQEAFPKIEVFRNVNGKSPLWLQKKDILALATDAPAAATHGDQTRTWFDLTDIRAIADFVETHACPLSLGR